MIRCVMWALLLGYVLAQAVMAQVEVTDGVDVAYRIENPDAIDQDDHCIWFNESSPADSRIICSDKTAGRVFVYNLNGELLQTVNVPNPGNIDCRNKVPITGGGDQDIVVVNEREQNPSLHVFRVDREKGKLVEFDNTIPTGENYGGCLFWDRQGSSLFAVITSKSGVVEQYRLEFFNEKQVVGHKVRSWQIGYCEGAVADDETGTLFVAEEDGTVWKLSGSPESDTPGEKLCAVGEFGLRGNLEGLALLQLPNVLGRCLVISDQGRNRYVVVTTKLPAEKVCEFEIDQGLHTDGIEIKQLACGDRFPEGVMVVHTDSGRRQPLVVDLRALLSRTPK